MKKYSFPFFLIQNAILFLISWLIAMGFAFLAFNENIPLSGLKWTPLTFPLLEIFYWFGLANKFTGPIARKTLAKNLKASNFGKTFTHDAHDLGTVGVILSIEEETGRAAYVSYQNPFKFQTAEAGELTDVISSYIHGPVGTTSYVYFQFRYKGKRTRIPTCTSGRSIMVTSPLAREGIAKADRLRDLVLRKN